MQNNLPKKNSCLIGLCEYKYTIINLNILGLLAQWHTPTIQASTR